METSVEYNKILESITALYDKIETLSRKKTPAPTRSEDLKELFIALAKAQAEMPLAGLNKDNNFFKSKYADLCSVVENSRPALTKYGLSVVQQILTNEDGQSILHTILCHSSGQWIESTTRIIPPKNDIQSFGSYITYLRRYAYSALVGVVIGDEDDDGEEAMIDAGERIAQPKLKYNPKNHSPETITREQHDELEYELEGELELAEEVLEKMQLRTLADMPKDMYRSAITKIREIKKNKNGQ